MKKQSKKLETGQKFGRLTIVKLDHIKEYISPTGIKSNREYYLCKCDCGKETILIKSSLIKNNPTKSCGCFIKNHVSELHKKNITHGKTKTTLYRVWQNMKARCYNKNLTQYKDWGGRGIIICNEWRYDFQAFYDWSIDNGYKSNNGRNILTLDRIDVNGNYEPSNCRWATAKEQARNQRTNHLITYNGETHCIAEWSEILDIKQKILIQRICRYKWNIDRALTQKVRGRND